MKPRHIPLSLAIAFSLATASSSAAAPKALAPAWVGAWTYVTTPLAPGVPAASPSWPFVRIVPLAPPSGSVATFPIAPVENPGGLPVDAGFEDLTDVTIRQIVRVSAAGSAVRLRLSNESGSEALALGAVHVGLAGPDGAIMPGTDRAVTFAGNGGIVIPAGAPLLSDTVPMPVKALDRLAISLYVPGRVVLRNARSLPAYIAGPNGDSTAAAQLPQPHIGRAPALLTAVEIAASQPTNVVVAFGDSITEGMGSTALAFHGWPDRLADRLAALPGPVHWAVVGAGISGNRLLRYGAGPNALARLDRDVLSVPGLKTIILLEGINDIGVGFNPAGSNEPVTADALKAAYRQIIERAHEHGVRVIGGTLTPYKGAGYASDAGEAVRQEINAWIRTAGVFDGVVDFDAAVADKSDPHAIDKAFNDGDRLHPNDAGYKAMADAVDLKLLTGR